MSIRDTTVNILYRAMAVFSGASVFYGVKRNRKSYIWVGAYGLVFSGALFFRNEIKYGVGTFCQTAQQGTESPHLGELSTGGISVFQKWANLNHNTGLSENGVPDQNTKDAYTQYGRDFLMDIITYYQAGN